MRKYKKYIIASAILLAALTITLLVCNRHTHSSYEWETVIEPTCIDRGERRQICLDCGEVLLVSPFPAYAEHTAVTDFGYPSTCTETGLSDGSHCSVCNAVLVQQMTLPLADHNHTVTGTVEPTCTTAGYKTYTCTCGDSYEAFYANPLEHLWATEARVEPTCTTDGYTEGDYCTRCGVVSREPTLLPAYGHSSVPDAGVDPTCTEPGTSPGAHCERCGEITKEQTSLPPLGHTIYVYESQEPDCVSDGWTEEHFCTVCRKTIVESVTIPAKGHNYISHNVTEPTCYLGGYTESTCFCGFVGITATTDPLGHNVVVDPAVDPTCTDIGYTEGSHCSRCDKVIEYPTVLSPYGHDITTVKVEPTLTADGSITDTCGRCNYVKVTPLILRDYTVTGYNERFCEYIDGTEYYNVVIPEIFENNGVWYKVVAIGDRAFKVNDRIVSIVIPDTVTYIGDEAFYRAYSLKSVTLSDNLLEIGDSAFESCWLLSDISLPNSITKIGAYAFSDCEKIIDIHLGDSLVELGEGAFSGCEAITDIVIPSSLKIISSQAFANCSNVINITISYGVERIESQAFYDCGTLVREGSNMLRFSLPDSVEFIGEMAFAYTGIHSLEIGDGDIIVDDNAFYYSKIGIITLGEGVKTFSDLAFSMCDKIRVIYNNSDTEITFGSAMAAHAQVIVVDGALTYFPNDGYEYIFTSDKMLFRYDGEKYQLVAYGGFSNNVTLPESINGHTYEIYRMGGAIGVTLPSFMTEISPYAFEGSFLIEVIIPEGVTVIGAYAFYGTYLTGITMPDSVIRIDEYAFSSCNYLGSITFSQGLKIIGENAFYGSGNYISQDIDIVIPDSVEAIGAFAFFQFSPIGHISIGSGLKELGYRSLNYCKSISVSENSEYFKTIDGHIYTKDGKTFVYYRRSREVTGESVVIADGVTTIAAGAFFGADISEVELPNTLIRIEMHAFDACKQLTSIVIPDSVEYLDEYAFYDCNQLHTVVVGRGVKQFAERAFFNHNISFYYLGTQSEWEAIDIYGRNSTPFNRTTAYFYCETAPATEGNYWHYDSDGNVVAW